jgi:hypothetical protein
MSRRSTIGNGDPIHDDIDMTPNNGAVAAVRVQVGGEFAGFERFDAIRCVRNRGPAMLISL